jgi:small multidrug resistance pump
MVFVMLGLAVASGTSGTLLTRASHGFSRWRYGLAAVLAYAVATVVMAWLVQRLAVGVVYAVWTGAAAVLLMAIDTLAFKVRTHPMQRIGMAITVAGVVLLASAVR